LYVIGRLIAGKICGIEISTVNIGSGKELIKKRFFGTLWSIKVFMHNWTITPVKIKPDKVKLRYFFYICGGVIFETLILLVVFLFFLINWDINYSINLPVTFIFGNIFTIICNMIPASNIFSGRAIKIKNDGKILLNFHKMDKYDFDEILSVGNRTEAKNLYESGNTTSAFELFDKTIELYPYSTSTYINYAYHLSGSLQLEKAEQYLLHALEINRDDNIVPLIYNNLAYIYLLYYNDSSLENANRYSYESVKLNCFSESIQNTRACVLIELGKVDEGIEILKSQIDYNKPFNDELNCPLSYIYLAYGYFKKGDKSEMKKCLGRLEENSSEMKVNEKYVFENVNRKTNNFCFQ
jgi:hypothetical protein